MDKKTNAEKQRAFKERMRKAGFKQQTYWIHEQDLLAVRRFITKLNEVRKC